MSKVSDSVPRGFSRFYILYLLKEKPMTGKEIMDEAEKRSGGIWKPSPGLVYPLLGRLAKENLTVETENGKFQITQKGEENLGKYVELQHQIERQIELVKHLGLNAFSAGKLMVEETLDKLTALASRLQEEGAKLSVEARKRLLQEYRTFLESELRRLEKDEKRG